MTPNGRWAGLDLVVDLKVYRLSMYRIGELAGRVGMSTPTLRYYEGIGLLDSSGRSPAGYRLYDEAAEARLEFIARAKRLGLSLGEIRSLVDVRDGGNCSATRAHLRHVVAHKIAEVRDRVQELATFERQLEAVYERVGEEASPAGCGDECECIPDLPETSKMTLTDELQLIEASECSCGGTCGTAGCSCGCACCGDSAQDEKEVMLHG